MGDFDSGLVDRLNATISKSGYTKADFADRIGIDGSKLSKILHGTRRITAMELALAAELADVDVDWLISGIQKPEAAWAARAEASSNAKAAVAIATTYDNVARLLMDVGAWSPPQPPASPSLTPGRGVEQGQALAEWALEVATSSGREHSGPYALEQICEATFGINIAIRSMAGGIDGLSLTRPGFRLAVINSDGKEWTRQRFTIAHEICHILCADSQDIKVDDDVMGGGTRRDHTEIRANSFAACFLMPETYVRDVWPVGQIDREQFSSLLCALGVSPAALSWRLFNLGLVSQSQRIYLSNVSSYEASITGGWESEFYRRREQQVTERAPGPLAEAARSAYADGLIGLRPLAAALGEPEDQYLSHVAETRPSAGSQGVDDAIRDEPVFSP
ncbi:MAG: ImmA/IrrE family metallo-endopeptidase [Actinobacteria bacterium]|nr:ImmA/IrrE family metallo-endopeptidase [Actinomycetota bacterium]